MEFVIGFIILLLALFVTGVVIKKKYFKEMDRLEAWKIDLTNRPVLDEMSKVKQLNMTGQTEELFERWRHEWDEVVTVKLPNLEELLFDAEDYIDKYRFNKAKSIQQVIEANLAEIESEIQKIIDELNELVGSEEKNRLEIEALKEQYRESKKNLLAHRHSFGKAEKQLEIQLEDIIRKIQEFDEKTESGDYLEAREIVLTIQNNLESIQYKMEKIPELLVECQTLLPSQMVEVKDGFIGMAQQGYYLEHIQLEKDLRELEGNLVKCNEKIEMTEIHEVEKSVSEIKEGIDILYDLLEKEALAKQFILQFGKPTIDLLESVQIINENLQEELLQVQQSYHLSDSELEELHILEKQVTILDKKLLVLEEKLESNETASSLLSEELKEVKDELESIRVGQTRYAEKLMALRKDEILAREKIKELSRKVTETSRLVTKSNIPGLPDDYKYLFQDSHESIQNVIAKLEEKPLDIYAVQQYLEIAVMTIEKLTSMTSELVENVILAEKVIQYGNRYRSKYPSVAKGLLEAEKSFRSYDYRTALEQAATSIEEIDPNAIKKIEAILSEK
ncbi:MULTISPECIES: septation ring formation regulator EzrA [unclassified Bacillus (in: firmicutes)]|uniref:septation ring formation regulator EzrA n=1 Tax=unclassified Bacillus (in: firmicutes) TaxID=185979 RepID=UPI0008E61CD5|nr:MULTISPECIES: septation ring formation regulator EzrA [unclassified Bacillus (in: firmicutes)]SFB17650.1 septation ring formation regulator [Bacillus sp. UNCCL13]SFQ76785.1 septation ring formation regulator [Bacillus sp. cl95]